MYKKLLAVLCLLFLAPVLAHASANQLPQSGQTTVYSANDDGDNRAGKLWPNPRFSDSGNQTVVDNLTGLIWAKDANLIKSHGSGLDTRGDGAISWQHALDYIHRLNAEKYLGHSDWRLPNLNELASMVNQGEVNASKWLNAQGVTGVEPLTYWTSSTNVMRADTAWTVGMSGGPVNYLKKSDVGYVWPVRGGESGGAASSGINLPRTGQADCFDTNGLVIFCAGTGQDGELQMGAAWPQPRFSDNGDQTVTDNLTNLIWTRDASLMLTRNPDSVSNDGALSWQAALDYVHKLNQDSYLGFSDWRLPNRNELASVMNYVETNPFAWLNWQGIFNVRNNYWTSATVAAFTGNAWNVNTTGVIMGENKTGDGSFVWPVRGGLNPETGADGSVIGDMQTMDAKRLVKSVAAVVPLSVTTTTLANGYIGTLYSQTLAAGGGVTPYTWSRSSGTLPAGFTLSTSGVLSGTPTTAKTSSVTFKVKDASAATATKTLSIIVNAALKISTTTLTNGYISVAYSKNLAATGGKAPYTWTVSSGALRAGLTLSSAGVVSGIPTAAGSSIFTAQVADANSVKTSKTLTLVINPALVITTTSLPDGYPGAAYSRTLAATGGKTAYTWTKTAGTLPAGLALSSAGVISGTPTAAGTSSFTVQVKDANTTTATKALTITIYAAPSVSTASLPAGIIGASYNQTLAATGGKTPYSWAVSAGTLPAGLTLSSAGFVSGTPTVSGSFSFTVQVADANNVTALKSLTLTVYAAITISPATLNDGYIGIPYNQPFSVTGGHPPYTWSISSGALPAGFSLTVNGNSATLSGTSAQAGSSTFTVQVTDVSTATSSKPCTINLTDFGSVSGTITDRDSGAPLQGVTVTLNLSGIASKDPGDKLYVCNATPFATPDYSKVLASDGSRFACATPAATGQATTFMVRNPFGLDDQLSM